MTFRRTLPSLLMSAALIVTAAATLGMPDGKLAGELLGGGYPSREAALALVGFIIWAVILGVALTTVVLSLRQANDSEWLHRRWTRAILFATAGIAVLGFGIAHHTGSGYSMCCGTGGQHLTEAQRLATVH
jgi:hypothetical protein